MRKIKLKTVRTVSVGSLILSFLTVGLAEVLDDMSLCIAAFVFLLAGTVFHLIFYRCPACGRHLGRNWGNYCSFCGEDLSDEEDLK